MAQDQHQILFIRIMSIKVLYFASLREELGRSEQVFYPTSPITAGNLWLSLVGKPVPKQVLCAINMDYASMDTTVCDGDEVAFFPPVTGGEHVC
jgi:sulfur-carrier protein